MKEVNHLPNIVAIKMNVCIYVQTPLCRDLVVHDDKLESKLSTAKLFDRPLFYSFRRDPAARYSIKLQLIQFTARHVEIKKNKNKKYWLR